MAQKRDKLKRAARKGRISAEAGLFLYGHHAVFAALRNPEREIRALYHSQALSPDAEYLAKQRGLSWQRLGKEELSTMLYAGSLHQGICAAVEPLPELAIEDFLQTWQKADRATLVVLDQVADGRNLGAVLRSAYCLGAHAVLCTDRHSASENGHLAKTASGALEAMPLVRITNLARALEQLKQIGFWCYGFDGDGNTELPAIDWPSHSALLFGAENTGLRRLSMEMCDCLVHIPHNPAADEYGVDSLNLAQSVSIALYARGIPLL